MQVRGVSQAKREAALEYPLSARVKPARVLRRGVSLNRRPGRCGHGGDDGPRVQFPKGF
jgi:hypothetical protein